MSKEMWDFSDDGQTYFDKTINFIGDMLNKWTKKEANHSLTIILFTRIWFGDIQSGKIFKSTPVPDMDIVDIVS